MNFYEQYYFFTWKFGQIIWQPFYYMCECFFTSLLVLQWFFVILPVLFSCACLCLKRSRNSCRQYFRHSCNVLYAVYQHCSCDKHWLKPFLGPLICAYPNKPGKSTKNSVNENLHKMYARHQLAICDPVWQKWTYSLSNYTALCICSFIIVADICMKFSHTILLWWCGILCQSWKSPSLSDQVTYCVQVWNPFLAMAQTPFVGKFQRHANK